MLDGDIIGEAHDHDSLVAVLRQRKDQLHLSDLMLDDLAGFTQGHAGKLLGPARTKTLGRVSLSAMLGALGLRLLVVVDSETAQRVAGRWKPRRERHVRRKAA